MQLRRKIKIFCRIFHESYKKEVAKIKTKEELSLVHEIDLDDYLDTLGILEDIKSGLVKCEHCNKVITLENLLCIYPKGGEIKVCCNSTYCYLILMGGGDLKLG